MDETLSLIREWFELEQKNDNCFYKLYTIKYPNSRVSEKDLRSTNWNTSNIDECIEKIHNDLRIHGSLAKEYFMLTHVSGKTDKSGVNLLFKNPLFNYNINNSIYSNAGVNGVNSIHNSFDNPMIELLKQHHENSQALKDEIQNLRHEHQIEKMESRISELEYNNRTFPETVSNFLQSDVGKQIVSSFTQLMSIKMQKPDAQTQNIVDQQPVQQTVNNESVTDDLSEDAEKEHRNNVSSLQTSLQRLDSVFGYQKGINALEKLATYCCNNPEMAKSILNNLENGTTNNI
jgi:hypothetical protein